MTTGNHLDIEHEPLPGGRPLELDREEAIVPTGEDSLNGGRAVPALT